MCTGCTHLSPSPLSKGVDDEPMCDGSDDDLGIEMDSDAAERYANSNHDKSSELCRYDSIQ